MKVTWLMISYMVIVSTIITALDVISDTSNKKQEKCDLISSEGSKKEQLENVYSNLTEFLEITKECVQHESTKEPQNWETTVDYFVRILNNYATNQNFTNIKNNLTDITSTLPEISKTKILAILELAGTKDALVSTRRVSSVDIAKFLLTTGADLNAESYDDNALHIAAQGGYIKLIEWLINTQDFNINKPGGLKRSPLFNAVIFHKFDAIKWIVSNTNADIYQEDENGQSPLIRAITDTDIGIYLIQHLNNTVKDSVVSSAATSPLVFIEVLKYMIENTTFNINNIDVSHVTDSTKLKYLIEKGANINSRDSSNSTVLHYITKDGDKDLFKWVLENTPIDVNAQDEYGRSALFFAITDVDKMKLLVKHGGDINIKNKFDQSILYKAKEGLTNRLYELFYHTSKEKIQEVVDYLESLKNETSE